jgi:hypothetical protein
LMDQFVAYRWLSVCRFSGSKWYEISNRLVNVDLDVLRFMGDSW